VSVAAGQYPGGQTLVGAKAAPGVTFQLDPNAVIGDISGSGQLNVGASYVTFSGGQIPAVAMAASTVSDHVVFRNVNGGRMWIWNASHDVSWIGGDLGPNRCSGGADTFLNTVGGATRITFDGVNFHDQRLCASGEHTETLRIDRGSSFVTVKNSSFANNDDTTSAIFITTQTQGVEMPHDVTVTNNVFGANGSGRMVQTQSPNVVTCINYTITNNRYPLGAAFLMLQCPSETNVVTSANTPG